MAASRKTASKKEHERYFFCKGKCNKVCSACQGKIISGSLIYHIIMTVVKLVAGVLTGSKVLVAEALHSFSDCFAFGVSYYGSQAKRLPLPSQSLIIGTIMQKRTIVMRCGTNIWTRMSDGVRKRHE